MVRSAVIDNSSLVNLSHLHESRGFFHYLRNLFHTIHFPAEVMNEYAQGARRETHRQWILERVKPDQGFYRFCNTYDPFIMIGVEGRKGIDKGEAEAYAQLKRVNAHIIISDDKLFISALNELDSTIRVYSTLHIICWLDIVELIHHNWNDIINELHRIRPFSSSDIRSAYMDVIRHLGLSVNRKKVSNKCSLSKIICKQK